jgi:lysophospholipase L1-like esterase
MQAVFTDTLVPLMHGRRVSPLPALLLFTLLTGFAIKADEKSFELTAEQKTRLERFLPHTYPKLVNREAVSALTLGDSVMDMYVHDEHNGDVLHSYAGLFLEQLGAQFYYTGGVLRLNGKRTDARKLLPVSGPEIRLNSGARGGKMMLHGIQALQASFSEESPDLVIVSFGINDANFGFDLSSFRRSLQEIIDTAHGKNSDVILLGPTPVVSDPPEAGLALTPPYSSVMKAVAEENRLFYCDLGDLAWLVTVDERYTSLLKPVPVKPAAEPETKEGAKPETASGDKPEAKAEAKAPAARPIVIPMPVELDPDAEKRAARTFADVVKSIRQWFTHGSTLDPLHPNTAAHRILARRIYSELLDGPKTVPWAVGDGVATLEGAGRCSVSFRLENTSTDSLRLIPLPLVTKGWKPVDAQSEIELKPGRRVIVTAAYQLTDASAALRAGEALLRLPILIAGGGMARIETITSKPTPFFVQWNAETRFNQSDTSELTATVLNTSKDALQGKWQASCMGQSWEGTLDLQPGASAPVVLKLKLPPSSDEITRRKGSLGLIVSLGSLTQTFNREVEICRNIGLKESVPLYPQEEYVLNKPAAPHTDSRSVVFRADADKQAFYLTWELRGINLHDSPDEGIACFAEVNLDGRTYGKRLAPGATDALRIATPAADGDARVTGLHPWNYGTGYAKFLDTRVVQAKFSSKPDGSRRLTLMIPSSQIYLHEWALGNGNSQLGINTAFYQWMPGDAGGASSFAPWLYSASGLHRDDALSLSVIELTDQPTKRWTVRLY